MSRALSLGLGWVADELLSDPPTRWHPVGLIGLAAGRLRELAPADEDARFRFGLAVAAGLPSLAGAAAAVLAHGARATHPFAGIAAEATIFSSTMSLSTLLDRAGEVAFALEQGDLPHARRLLGYHLVSRDTAALDEAGVAAAAIESVAENLSDGVIAPVFAHAIGGAPAAMAYRAANTLDALWGYRDAEFEQLGKAAARLDDVLNLVPARVSVLAIVAASAALRRPDIDARRALEVWRADRWLTSSPNAGHPMAAMAGALGVRLEKRGDYVLGESLRPPVAADIERANAVAGAAARLVAAGLFAVLLLSEVRR